MTIKEQWTEVRDSFKFVRKEYIRRNLKYIAYAYIAVIAIWIIHLYWFLNYYPKNDYHLSLSASLAEDLLFFGILGALVFFYSLRDGSDLSLRHRVSILANKKGIDDNAVTYLLNHIQPVLSYNKSTNIDITIDDVTDDKKYIRVFCDVENRIVNMCSNDAFELKNSDFKIEALNKIGHRYGFISYVGIKNLVKGEGASSDLIFVSGPGNKPLQKKKVVYPIDNFVIPNNGIAESKMSWAVWEELNSEKLIMENWYYIANQRFTNKIHLDLSNRVEDLRLFFDIRIHYNQSGEKRVIFEGEELNQKVKVIPIKEQLFPKDMIQMIFYTKEE
ncbi:hypothetical protein [Flagellimonas iocasae]|uniref:SMODS-associating 2TM beta-strand rich effector domain-containing protein n=1 Tax=Flagellimonas iocasae TaxID=2055905 RepID=A0ABW4Y2B7_9FLAO